METEYKSPYGNDEDTLNMDYKHTDAYQMCYDLSVYLHKKVTTFPKYEKFTLSQEIRQAVDDIMDELEMYEKTKVASHLYAADRHKSRLVRKIRLAHDLKYSGMNNRSYHYVSLQIGYMGGCIGGLIKKVKEEKKNIRNMG